MKNLKLMTTLVLAFAFLFAQVGNVAAAPAAQDTPPITGTIDTIVVEPDANGDPVVIVTLEDGQIYHFSVETATSLNLLLLDPVTGEPIVDPATGLPQADGSQEGQPIEFLPTDVIPDETEEEPVHPISALLGEFFDVEASLIDEYHTNGFGFGLIAQALWIEKNLDGQVSFDAILDAKKEGSGTFTVNGEVITYTNWGQLKKALLEKHNSLGGAKHPKEDENSTPSLLNDHGNGNSNGKGQDHGKGNGNGNGHNKNKP